MTGIDSYSPTPLTNETVDGTTTWKENQLPSTVNNSMRRILADIREQLNDFPWFQYGTGDQNVSTHLAVPSVYASATSFTITGADVTAVYHAGRRVRAVGSLTGTIYGTIASSSYNGGTTATTVVVVWDSGSLTNETLVICISLIPGTGDPVPVGGVAGTFIIGIEHTKDNGATVLSTGITGGTRVPFACTITGWAIIGDPSGSIVFDIWKKAFAANDPPTVANTITASAKPTVTSAKSAASTTLTGWTTSLAANDEIRFNIDSVSSMTWATLILTCTRTL